MNLLGLSGRLMGRPAWEVGKPLMDQMWHEVKAKAIPNLGRNVWFYGSSGELFVGVEIPSEHRSLGTTLEEKTVVLAKYAVLKHTGPYSALGESYASLDCEIKASGKVRTGVQVEVYGHDHGPAVPEVDLLIEIE